MHVASTNQIADILHFNNNSMKYKRDVLRKFDVPWLFLSESVIYFLPPLLVFSKIIIRNATEKSLAIPKG